jgi:hypothetical protein
MIMGEAARLSALIGDIYDAALEPGLWTGVVEKAGRFVGGSGASIFSRDSVRRTGNAHYKFGVDPWYEQLYFEKYIKLDPLNAAYLMLGVGDVTSNSIIVDALNSPNRVSIRNGHGRRVGSTMSSPRSSDRRPASPASWSSATNAMALPTTTRADACGCSRRTCVAPC